jgi:transposase-like protein
MINNYIKNMNFFEFLEKFPTEEKVIEHFTQVRYSKDKPVCNHCKSEKKIYKRGVGRFYDCKECGNSFSIFKDTIFENTTTDLRKWMYAIHLFLNGKKGISGLQLQREIKVTYKTAWRMLKMIRQAMGNKENQKFVDTILEIDETYIGGKPRKKNEGRDDDNNKPNKRGRGTKKKPVVGIIDRNNKQVHARVALPNKEGKKLTGKQLLDILKEVAKADGTDGNVVITDEFKGYNILKKTKQIHLRVDHTQEFVRDAIHTNGIESFWATLKRGVLGIYHHISPQYLQSYVDEFCFRYNNRDNDGVFNLVLKQAIL